MDQLPDNLNPDKPEKKLLPAIRSDLQLYPVTESISGQPGWILFDPVSDGYFRLTRQNHEILCRFYEGQDVETLIKQLAQVNIPVTEAEIFQLLNFLRSSGLLYPTPNATAKELKAKAVNQRKAFIKSLTKRYMFFKIPLVDPDNFLKETAPYVSFLFNKYLISLLCLISLAGFITLIPNLSLLGSMFLNSFSWGGMIRFVVALTIIKIFHELGHAYAARINNIRVRKMGIFFMVMMPRLYTDVTDTWRIDRKRTRMFISAAGIIIEFIFAGFAAIIWQNSSPTSLIGVISYNVFAVSIINTVLINANPLMRYDGYYILMDFIGIDNLQQTGYEYSKAFFRRVLLGVPFKTSRHYSGFVSVFLVLFGFACFLYKIVIYTGIIMIIYFNFTKALAIGLIFLELYAIIIKPLVMEYKIMKVKKAEMKKRYYIPFFTSVVALMVALSIPLPWTISLPCEVKSSNQFVVYARNDGFLNKLNFKDGDKVEKGQQIFDQTNPYMQTKLKVNNFERQRLHQELDILRTTSETISEAGMKLVNIANVDNIITEFKRRENMLKVNSPFKGVFTLYDRELKPGKWLYKGEPIGEISNPEDLTVYAYVKESDIAQFAKNETVKITLNGILKYYTGTVSKINTVSIENLNDSSLLSIYGGPINAIAQGDKLHFVEPYFQVKVKPEKKSLRPHSLGRTGIVEVKHFRSILVSTYQKTLIMIQNEFSF